MSDDTPSVPQPREPSGDAPTGQPASEGVKNSTLLFIIGLLAALLVAALAVLATVLIMDGRDIDEPVAPDSTSLSGPETIVRSE